MKAGKKTLLLVGIPVGLGVAALLAVVLLVLKPFDPTPAVPDPVAGQHGVMLPLDTKVVNLSPGGDYKYAKVGVTLELRPDKADFYKMAPADREAAAAIVVKNMADELPMLDDAVARVVSAKSSSDLLAETGREQLKQELLDAVRGVLDGESPSASAAPAASGTGTAPPASGSELLELYFTDLVMQ